MSAMAVVVVLIPILIAFSRSPNEDEAVPLRATGSMPTSTESSGPWTRATALRSAAFWTAAGPYALALAAQVGVLVHLLAILEMQVDRGTAALAASITGICGFIGRVGLGTVVDRLNQRYVFAASLVSQAVALIIMLEASDQSALLVACGLFGLSIGNVTILPVLIIQHEFDPRSFGLLVGLATGIAQLTFAFGPGVLGFLRDTTGNYHASLLFCIALQITASIIVFFGRKFTSAKISK
jgi:predicted MFS family arabinose efflux permease